VPPSVPKQRYGRSPDSPGQIKQSLPKKGSVDVIIQNRGGTGTARKASPDPHTTHSPEAIAQGVYE